MPASSSYFPSSSLLISLPNALIYGAWQQGSQFKALGVSVDPTESSQNYYARIFNIKVDGTLEGCLTNNAVMDIKDSLVYTESNITSPNTRTMQFAAPLTIPLTPASLQVDEKIICENACTMRDLRVSGDTVLCNNNSTVLTAQRTGTCTDPVEWETDPSFADIQVIDPATARITFKRDGHGIVKARWRNACSMIEKPVNLYAGQLPPLHSLGRDTSICAGDTLTLKVNFPYNSIQWSNNAINVPATKVFTAGQHWVKVSMDNICFLTDTMKIESLYPLPVINIHDRQTICLPDPLLLQPGPGYASYRWQDGSAGSSYAVQTSGRYWVTVSDQHQCIGSDTVDVLHSFPKPTGFAAFEDSSICIGQQVWLTLTKDFAQYNWNNGASFQKSFPADRPGLYIVQVKDANGCSGADSILLKDKGRIMSMHFPNAVVAGGRNSQFKALFRGAIPVKFKLVIFGRWGEKVFETTNPFQGWNGQYKGNDQYNNQFAWFCTYQFPGQEEKTTKGTVVLIR